MHVDKLCWYISAAPSVSLWKFRPCDAVSICSFVEFEWTKTSVLFIVKLYTARSQLPQLYFSQQIVGSQMSVPQRRGHDRSLCGRACVHRQLSAQPSHSLLRDSPSSDPRSLYIAERSARRADTHHVLLCCPATFESSMHPYSNPHACLH